MPVVPLVGFILVAIVAIWMLLAITHAVFSLIPILLIGLIAGWAASKLVGSRFGLLGTAFIGIVGSLIGPVLFSSLLHIYVGGRFGITNIIASVVGATLLLAIARVTENRRALHY